MFLAGVTTVGIIAAIVFGAALAEKIRLGITFHQALLYLPLRIVYRIGDSETRLAREAEPPVVYAVSHQSRLDPALMLCLLPQNTLHILDERSARSYWLEPWRELARTIAFNAEHVFVSRRLVRHLKGRGRLAVYFPDVDESDARAFRLYRAVARIARKADAKIVPVFVRGASRLPFALDKSHPAGRSLFPRLVVSALEPMTLTELGQRTGRETASGALYERVVENRLKAA